MTDTGAAEMLLMFVTQCSFGRIFRHFYVGCRVVIWWLV